MFAALTGEFGHKAQRPKFVITVFKGSNGVYVCVCVYVAIALCII